ncbi:MAG: hypothetical protein KF708_20305 [Pirellulales bacterium]|nr:hypothetical protein [Pirellulales bacterium]
MVEGLARFRSHFADFTDQYVLIGGAAGFVPDVVKADLKAFLDQVKEEGIDLKALGVVGQTRADIEMELRRIYQLA